MHGVRLVFAAAGDLTPWPPLHTVERGPGGEVPGGRTHEADTVKEHNAGHVRVRERCQ